MVAIVRAVLTAGHAKPYRPIDLKLLPPNLPYPRVEPGRVEVGEDMSVGLAGGNGSRRPMQN